MRAHETGLVRFPVALQIQWASGVSDSRDTSNIELIAGIRRDLSKSRSSAERNGLPKHALPVCAAEALSREFACRFIALGRMAKSPRRRGLLCKDRRLRDLRAGQFLVAYATSEP